MRVVIKWNKLSFECDLDPELGAAIFKSQVYSLTGVPVDRQKLMAKGAWQGVLKDDADMAMMPIVEGQQVMLMGTADVMAAPVEKVHFLEDMTGEQKAVKGAVIPAGLANLGNTCYMNATLQCFRGMPELRSALDQVAPSPSDFSVSLRETLKQLDRAGASVVPSAFVNLLRTRFPQFAQRGTNGGYMQQDAEEFYNTVTQAISASMREGSQPQDFSDYLGLRVEETLVCLESESEVPVVKQEQTNKLVCNIQGGAGAAASIDFIQDGLKLGLEGTVEKFSSTLDRNAMWRKTQKISKLPRFVCVQFMRFFWKPTPESRDHAGVKCKILRPVAFSESLDLYDFCVDKLQAELRVRRERSDRQSLSAPSSTQPMETSVAETADGDAAVQPGTSAEASAVEGFSGVYELMGVVTHKGRSADSGHYISWVRQAPSSDFWWKYDDEVVTEMRTADVLDLKGNGDSHAAYLNMYRAKSLP